MNSLDRMLSVLDLFRDGYARITHEDVENLTEASRATAYRYLQSLTNAGLITPIANGAYGLGARIIELDRLQRATDPMLAAAQPVMQEVSERLGYNMILSSYYGDRVLCSHLAWPDKRLEQIYERGRPMPMFYGAMAKVILANLTPYQLRNLMLIHVDEIRKAGLGDDWKQFRSNMARLRKQRACITKGEITSESFGVGAPIFDHEGRVVGSIVFAIPPQDFERVREDDLRGEILQAADSIMNNMVRNAQNPAAPKPALQTPPLKSGATRAQTASGSKGAKRTKNA